MNEVMEDGNNTDKGELRFEVKDRWLKLWWTRKLTEEVDSESDFGKWERFKDVA